jgi:hypothetical protein
MFRILLKYVYGMPNYAFYPRQSSLDPSIAALHGLIGQVDTPMPSDAASDSNWYFSKTHELPQEDFPAIYLIRDGRDAMVSYAHYILDYVNHIPVEDQPNCFYDTLRDVIVGLNFGGWSNHILAWTQRSTPTAIVKYEDLIADPIKLLHDAASSIGFRPSEAQRQGVRPVPDFDSLNRTFPTFFRKGKVGAWKEEMPEDMYDLFWQHHSKAMDQLGYER